MGKTAVIFPGQGAQAVGMGRDIVERSRAAREVFEKAKAVLGFDLADLCFNGPADKLNSTEISQPAIFVTSVAVWHAIQETPAAAAAVKPEATAGLSLGEYTALWLAQSMSFADALALVQKRGQFMQQSADARPSGMVSVMGLDDAKLAEAISEAAAGEILVAANYNSPGQVVISGDLSACQRAAPIVEKLGGRAIPLRVAGAFHSPLMQPAGDKLSADLKTAQIQSPRLPVVSNVTADYHRGSDDIRTLLKRQVSEAIRWSGSIQRLIADGFDRFVEVGPGRVLTGLMRSINRTVKAVNVSTTESLDKLAGTQG